MSFFLKGCLSLYPPHHIISIYILDVLNSDTTRFSIPDLIIILSASAGTAMAGPAAYAICQSACSASLMAGLDAPAAYAACQAGVCGIVGLTVPIGALGMSQLGSMMYMDDE